MRATEFTESMEEDMFGGNDEVEQPEQPSLVEEHDPLTQARQRAKAMLQTTAPSQQQQEPTITQQVSDHYNPHPSADEVVMLRSGYSDLLRTLKENKQELLEPRSTGLTDLIEQSNALHLHVHRTVDATLDSRFMAASADIGAQKLNRLPLSTNAFTVADLTDSLQRLFKKHQNGARALGLVAAKHWRGFQGIETIVGLVEMPEKTKVTRKRAAPSDTKSLGPAVTPSIVTAEDLKRADAPKETTDLVISVYEQLVDLCPVPFYKAVIDPGSFARSVELLFYFSFLVADGKIRLTDQLIVELIDDGDTAQRDDAEAGGRRHKIFNMSMSTWREKCAEFKLKKPLINL